MFKELIDFIRKEFDSNEFIPLHAPLFIGNERRYVLDTIDSTFVSSVGKYVDKFEEQVKEYTGSKFAIATVNGTSALHMSLILAGVKPGDLVLTQSLSFIATCNAINYLNADPIFIDVDIDTLGLSSNALDSYLKSNSIQKNGECFHKDSNRRISACVPMHTFGHPVKIDEISEICNKYKIELIEDSAESIGSLYKGKHTGTFGKLGAFSFNGNKTITCGGGGIIITNDEKLGILGKHLTTQAKVPHPWNFVHDSIGYNYRMPNINAALACAQIEKLDDFIDNKRTLARSYENFFKDKNVRFVKEPEFSRSNYWLNSILVSDKLERDQALIQLNQSNIMVRPSWDLMHTLSMFQFCYRDEQYNAKLISDRLINLPSSVRNLNND